MKFLKKMKDGGPESTSTGYWIIEWKKAFSIVLLRFDGKSREAFHTHAFNCLSWVVKGGLRETFKDGNVDYHYPSFKPFVTRRTDFHMVDSYSPFYNTDNLTSWVFSIRGPWVDKWKEWLPKEQKIVNLTHGRVVTN
jgi:hypothetical protein